MKLNRKLWTAALAVAMTTPSAMAAQDTAGMHYTSAAEGFYASIRVRYVSNGGSKDGGADLQDSSSRFGVRGTNDLGGGLEGFYRYEASISTHQGGGLSTRLGHVGLRGDFGSVVAGAFWPDTYNWVYGSTDVANRHSGNAVFDGAVGHAFGQYRTNKSLQYTTPDLNGFQAAVLIKADSGSDGEGSLSDPTDRLMLTETVRIVGGDRDGEVFSTRTFAVSGKPGGDPKEEINWEVLDELTSSGDRRVPVPASRQPYADDLMRELPDGTTVTVNVLFEVDTERNPGNPKDDNDVDHWSIAAKYDIAGFSTAFSYSRYADAVERHADLGKFQEDESTRANRDSWAFKLGYSQDNWYVNGWYGEISDSDGGVCGSRAVRTPDPNDEGRTITSHVAVKCEDTDVFSIAGGITVDKVALYAVHENVGAGSKDNSYSTLGAQYTLGSNSWTWIEYAGRDLDSKDNEDSDFSIGLGHSF